MVSMNLAARMSSHVCAAGSRQPDDAAWGAARRAPTIVGWSPGGLPVSCPVAARPRAPGPRLHRVHVFHVALRWSLVLADAVCWGLVEVVRSAPPARGGTLGSFYEFIVLEPLPAMPWAESADLRLVFPPVLLHPRPWWHANAAPSVARAAARLAGWTRCVAECPCPYAGTFARSCTAVTSSRSTPTTVAPAAHARGTRRRRSTAAAAARFGRFHPMLLDAAPRLSARGATRAAWRPASAEASSRTGEEREGGYGGG